MTAHNPASVQSWAVIDRPYKGITMRVQHAAFVTIVMVALLSVFRADAQQGPGARGGGPAAQNPNSVSPIEFLIDPPTLINLGFEWFIQGDENRNATVTVSYRKKGETTWKPALPMLRLKGERVYQASQVDVIAPNMFAGSIQDLEPDTAYEAQFDGRSRWNSRRRPPCRDGPHQARAKT